MRPRLKVLLSILVAASSCMAPSSRDSLSPSCLGEFCFDREPPSDAEFVAQYGSGHSEGGKFPYHCFRVSPAGPYVRFRVYHGEPQQILDVFLSDVPNCPSADAPTKKFAPMRTEAGLALGDPQSRVVGLYGEPERVRPGDALEMIGDSHGRNSQPFGEVAMFYFGTRPETLHSVIYLRNGIVAAILISQFP